MYVAPYCIVRMSGSRLMARYSIMRRLCIVCGSRLSEEQRGCRRVTILEPTMGGALNYYIDAERFLLLSTFIGTNKDALEITTK